MILLFIGVLISSSFCINAEFKLYQRKCNQFKFDDKWNTEQKNERISESLIAILIAGSSEYKKYMDISCNLSKNLFDYRHHSNANLNGFVIAMCDPELFLFGFQNNLNRKFSSTEPFNFYSRRTESLTNCQIGQTSSNMQFNVIKINVLSLCCEYDKQQMIDVIFIFINRSYWIKFNGTVQLVKEFIEENDFDKNFTFVNIVNYISDEFYCLLNVSGWITTSNKYNPKEYDDNVAYDAFYVEPKTNNFIKAINKRPETTENKGNNTIKYLIGVYKFSFGYGLWVIIVLIVMLYIIMIIM